jgi:predicted nuclease of predicted toxin-antitoxin system
MRLLLDQDVYANTARFLGLCGHDVLTAAQAGLSQASDEQLLLAAHETRRLFLTRDRDFGNLVFVRSIRVGVLYLRMLPHTQRAVHDELDLVLKTYSEEELRQSFLVIEPGRHRIRRLPRE